nr:MAG TPA: conotoxin [Caudoviricetes sp.]DAW32224.1 MAG TPA: conotoxin [Caudoviricetes sp.]
MHKGNCTHVVISITTCCKYQYTETPTNDT